MNTDSWIKFLGGDENAFSDLYRSYFNELFAYGLKIGFDEETCKDAIQDVFYKIYTSRKQLTHVRNIEHYLLHCLKNRLFDIHNAALRINDISHEHITVESDDTIIEQIIEKEMELQKELRLKKSLASLPAKQRKIIYFHYQLNLSFDEIATLLDMNPDTVKKSTYRALQKLRDSQPNKINLLVLLLSFI